MKTSKIKTKIYLMLTMIIALTFSECKKYDEGPALSMRSKQKRVEGEWDITAYTINGENELASTEDYNYACSTGTVFLAHNEYNTSRFVWTFNDKEWNYSQTENSKQLDQQFTYYNCFTAYKYNTYTNLDNGTWKFISGKERMELTTISGEIITFIIRELKEKEMKLESNDQGEIIKYTFTKR